ncbi:putative multiple epidermal growth factor-like domains protein 11, partial [Apostichopus japonicus]
TYCPQGSNQPIPCPLGQYCEGYANQVPDGDCLEGFFCNGSASVRDPVQCSDGYYCPEGTPVEEPCPPGTFSGHRGNINISDCNQCTPGWYCESYGLSEPTAECSPGYYCPGGQNTSQPVELACSPGHFCLEGSWNQTGCPSGYYQPHWRAYDCDICPQGSYCKAFGDYEVLDAENVTESGNFSGRYRSYRGVSVPTVCPAGSYCPMGTEFGTQYLCPEGTFSNRTSLYNDTQCEPCKPGMYCMGEGNTAPSDVCAAGHYCTRGYSATPTDGTTGDICPPGYYCSGSSEEAAPVGMPYGDVCWPGHYCPNGTDIPDPCPPGTFLDISGAEEEDDCIACTPGRVNLFYSYKQILI